MGKIRTKIGCWRRKIFGDDSDKLRALTAKVDSLEFFLKSMYDITKVPKAIGVLRLIQLADLALIKTVADILERHGLAYWIESGTLLGAVRHGGFIPWDDDADLGMMRADCAAAARVLADELCAKGRFRVVRANAIRIGLEGTPCQVDIFPYDRVGLESRDKRAVDAFLKEKKVLCDKIHYDWSHLDTDWNVIPEFSVEQFDSMANELCSRFAGPEKLLGYGFEADTGKYRFCIWEGDLFPLKPIAFEGLSFPAPNVPDAWLFGYYGDYMAFPDDIHPHADIRARISKEGIEEMKRFVDGAGIQCQ